MLIRVRHCGRIKSIKLNKKFSIDTKISHTRPGAFHSTNSEMVADKSKVKKLTSSSSCSSLTTSLYSLQSGRLRTRQIEAARRLIAKRTKKIGTYKVHINPVIGVSKKPLEVRMGKGKGALDHYIARIKGGQILFTIAGISPPMAKAILKAAKYKLPLQTKII